MTYIFLYNVVYIKTDFSRLKSLLNPQDEFILIGSDYCLSRISPKNKQCFNSIHQISRNFHEIDYHETKEIVASYVKKFGAEFIMLLTNEDSTQIACAKLRELFKIKGATLDLVIPFVNKIVSKNALASVVNMYKFVSFSKDEYRKDKTKYLQTIIDKIGIFPIFAKPIDLVSSIGVCYIDNMDKLIEFADNALSSDYNFEIDEFIDGELFHCDSIIINGTVKFFMVGKCSFPLARFFDGKPVGSIPIIDKNLFERLKEFNNKVLNKLNGTNGVYHLEVFLQRETNEIIFLEVAARTGGASITNVYEKVFGINIEEINYRIQMDLTQDFDILKRNIYAGFLNFPNIKGEVKAINKPQVSIANEFIEFAKVGDTMLQAKNLLDIACIIVFWDTDYNQVTNCFEMLKNYRVLELKDSPT